MQLLKHDGDVRHFLGGHTFSKEPLAWHGGRFNISCCAGTTTVVASTPQFGMSGADGMSLGKQSGRVFFGTNCFERKPPMSFLLLLSEMKETPVI